MKRKCKLLAILTTAILLLTSVAAAAEMIIIEDIPMGELYRPTIVADDNGHRQNHVEEIEIMENGDGSIVIEEDMDGDELIEVIAAPTKPMGEMEDEVEWITPPQIMAEEEDMIVAPTAPITEEEATERQTTIADISISFNGDKIFLGDTVTFTASIEDCANAQWQQQRPGQGWTDLSGENGANLHIVVTSDNADNAWRCLVAA